jgi:hypothetical protein
MYYVLVVRDQPKQEICGVTNSKEVADSWLADSLIGIAPKRVVLEYAEGNFEVSYLEGNWLYASKSNS